MDKQIHKIQRDIKKTGKDTKNLLKMDKKFDREIETAKKITRKSKYER